MVAYCYIQPPCFPKAGVISFSLNINYDQLQERTVAFCDIEPKSVLSSINYARVHSWNFTLYFAIASQPIVFIVGSGPTCNATQSASGNTTITCSITYADFPVIPMIPVITCTADGQLYKSTDPASRTLIDPKYYVFDSTTVIKIGSGSASTYDCNVTFLPPDLKNNPSYKMFVVQTAPNFTANITGKRWRVIEIILSQNLINK